MREVLVVDSILSCFDTVDQVVGFGRATSVVMENCLSEPDVCDHGRGERIGLETRVSVGDEGRDEGKAFRK